MQPSVSSWISSPLCLCSHGLKVIDVFFFILPVSILPDSGLRPQSPGKYILTSLSSICRSNVASFLVSSLDLLSLPPEWIRFLCALLNSTPKEAKFASPPCKGSRVWNPEFQSEVDPWVSKHTVSWHILFPFQICSSISKSRSQWGTQPGRHIMACLNSSQYP